MRILAVALFASVLVAVSMAAPTTSEVRYINSVEGNDDTQLDENIDYVALLTCSNDVSKETTAEFNLTSVWEAYETQLLEHLANLTACTSAGDEDAVQACQQTVLQAANTTYRDFINDVRELNPEAAKEIYVRYHSVCRATPPPQTEQPIAAGSYELNNEASLFTETSFDYVALFTCAIGAGENATQVYQLDTVWGVYEPKLLAHLANLVECANAGDEDVVQACFDTEVPAANATYFEFLGAVDEQSEEAVAEIFELIRTVCYNFPPTDTTEAPTTVSSLSYESNEDAALNGTVDYVGILTCTIEVGKNVTEEYELVVIWEAYEPQLLVHLANFTSCATTGDADAVEACYNNEVHATNETLRNFLATVRDVDQEAADKIVLLYHNVCRASPSTQPTEAPSTESTTVPALSFQLNDDTPSNETIDYVALFTCANEVSAEITAAYNLTSVWETYEPELSEHLANLTACPSAGDEDAVQACQQTVLQAANTTYRAFINDVRELNPEAADVLYVRYLIACRVSLPPTDPTEEPTYDVKTFESDEELPPVDGSTATLLQCAIKIGRDAVNAFELNGIWETFEPLLEEHLENIENCIAAGDEEAIEVCYALERQAAKATYLEFLDAVREQDALAADIILENVRGICLNSAPPTEAPSTESTTVPALSFQLNDETPSNETIDYVALFTCTNEVSAETTAEYNLTSVWETYAPELLDHLANLTACPSAGDEDAVQACQQTVLQAANTTYRAFFNAVKELNPEAADVLYRRYFVACRVTLPPTDPTEEPTYDVKTFESDEELPPVNGSTATLLQCAIDIGRNAAEAYELTGIWETFEPRLEEHLENIENCIAAGDEEAIEVCYALERQAAKATYLEFLDAVREQDVEAADTILEYIRDQCLNSAPPTEAPTEPTNSDESF